MALSKGVDGQTIVNKKDIPTFTKLGELLNADPSKKAITRQTIATHFKYLITAGYLKETEDGTSYYILNPDKYYHNIPPETIEYLNHSVNGYVYKVYIYLGVCWNINPGQYKFTIKEICQHLGLNYENFCKRIRDNLDLLIKLELIDIDIIYENNLPYMILSKYTTDFKLSDKVKKSR